MSLLQISSSRLKLLSTAKKIPLRSSFTLRESNICVTRTIPPSVFKFHSTKSTTGVNPDGSIPLAYSRFPSEILEKKDQPDKIVIIMHGLFGSKQNWSTLGKAFAQKLKDHAIYCLDSRNHGDSPHSEEMGYVTMANDVASFIRSLPHSISGPKEITLVGHSMGGRIAMAYALASESGKKDFPALHKLVVVDINPKSVDLKSQFELYIGLMMKIDQAEVIKQSDADQMMRDGGIEDIGIRQFLLTNLKKVPGTGKYRFRNPLSILNSRLGQLGETDPIFEKEIKFPHPTLFVAGSRSNYLKPKHREELKKTFTDSDMKFLDTGHWVHAEKPREFLELVSQFILKEIKHHVPQARQ